MLQFYFVMDKYEDYKNYQAKIADLKNSLAVLQWDQEVYLPTKGAGFRARQMATLSEQIHELSTAESFGHLLQDLVSDQTLGENEKKNIELSWEDYSKQKKYSAAFVRKMSETVSRSFHSWIEARRQNDFTVFENDLNSLLELKKEETHILGFAAHPYDSLLNEFEKGCTVAQLDKLFAGLQPRLKDLLDKITGRSQVEDSFLRRYFPKQEQWEFGLFLIRELGFDFEAGRQDISEHPFTTSFNVRDVRITTRIDENNFGKMTWSCIHETGHALYEQGLPESEYGLPSGEYASLGIHESQSRLWENNVGRSLGFWSRYFGELQDRFAVLKGIGLQEFYHGINKVEPSLIRTEADELTYHFHVMIRYELEKALIDGKLSARDIPVYWREQYRNYLNVEVQEDKTGALQDVHWSHGSFGYFPTYSLGSFYAAQLYHAAGKDLDNLEESIRKGKFSELLGWLRQRIHAFGRLKTSEELCKEATGEPLSVEYFMGYLIDKYTKIYDI